MLYSLRNQMYLNLLVLFIRLCNSVMLLSRLVSTVHFSTAPLYFDGRVFRLRSANKQKHKHRPKGCYEEDGQFGASMS